MGGHYILSALSLIFSAPAAWLAAGWKLMVNAMLFYQDGWRYRTSHVHVPAGVPSRTPVLAQAARTSD